MWLPWHSPGMTSENVSHGEVEAANKYFSIFFLKPDLSMKVSKRSEISRGGGAKGPCSPLAEVQTLQAPRHQAETRAGQQNIQLEKGVKNKTQLLIKSVFSKLKKQLRGGCRFKCSWRETKHTEPTAYTLSQNSLPLCELVPTQSWVGIIPACPGEHLPGRRQEARMASQGIGLLWGCVHSKWCSDTTCSSALQPSCYQMQSSTVAAY